MKKVLIDKALEGGWTYKNKIDGEVFNVAIQGYIKNPEKDSARLMKLIKNGTNPKKNVWIESETKDFKQKILDSGCSKNIKQNNLKIYEEIGTEVFGNSRVVEILRYSKMRRIITKSVIL